MNHLTAEQIRAFQEGGHPVMVRLTRRAMPYPHVVYEGPATIAISRTFTAKGNPGQRLPEGQSRIDAINLSSPVGVPYVAVLGAWPEAEEDDISESGVIIVGDHAGEADYQAELFSPDTVFASQRVEAAIAHLRNLGREDLIGRLALVAEQFIHEATTVHTAPATSPAQDRPSPLATAPEGETEEELIQRVAKLMREKGDALTPHELRAIELMRQGAVLRYGQARVERKGRSGDDFFVPNTEGGTPRNLAIKFIKIPWLTHYGLIHEIEPNAHGQRQFRFGPAPKERSGAPA